MSRTLKRDIRQKEPFGSPEQELFLEIQRTADVLMRGLEELLKPSGLTQTQYNVLRILRGAGPAGLTCREVAGRMVTQTRMSRASWTGSSRGSPSRGTAARVTGG